MNVNANDIDGVIDGLVGAGGVSIKGYRSEDELVRELQCAIENGTAVIFAPTMKSMRVFFNTEGFVTTMTSVLSKISEYDLVVPPDCYGSKHVMAIQPKLGD